MYTYGGNNEVVISSFDSDFFQLISENVSVLRYRGDSSVVCTPEYIREKFGIAPSQYADFKALTGDKADNIKGADKVGLKTAAQLICDYGDLEGVLAGADTIQKPSIRESVIRSTDRLRTNYRLIKLEGAETLPFKIDELSYRYDGITTNEVLKAIGVK